MGIGATDFIKIDEVRKEIDSAYPNPGRDVDGLEVEHSGYSHRLIGNAFEFVCRLWLTRQSEVTREPFRWDGLVTYEDGEPPRIYSGTERRIFDKGEEPEESLLESERVQKVRKHRNRTIVSITPKSLYRAKKHAEQFVKTGMNADEVVNAALLYSGWDQEKEENSSIDLESFNDDLVTELQGLFNQLRSQEWTTGELTYLNPNFGQHWNILEGEADFIIDDLLVDVKTTEDETFTPAFWRQLLTYYILNDVQRVLYEETDRTDQEYPKVNRVGIYFARYGELQTVDMDDIINDRDEYERFRAWFVDRAIEENHHAQYDYSGIRASLTDPYDFERQKTLFDY
ncbi:hypothetical protein [Halorussus lipolyticus]|uniref:hypothetical protein n=1 Tax=Halorussus lipolyticus TaxID=3034024 RepID=UPI0023E87286|nr:hypothetical protein [Halorussus sp. DT80]